MQPTIVLLTIIEFAIGTYLGKFKSTKIFHFTNVKTFTFQFLLVLKKVKLKIATFYKFLFCFPLPLETKKLQL